MNDSEILDGAPSQVHSLAISPDLNALLEHDERTRGPHQPDASSPHFWQTPLSGSSNSTFPVGLPPPPRGNRKALSRPTTPKESESLGTRSKPWSEPTEPLPDPLDSSPLLTNPFINAPPKLLHPHRSNEREQSNRQFSGTFETLDSFSKLNRVVDPVEPDPPDLHSGSASPRPTDQPIVRTHSVPRVEKLIGKGKSMFSISASQPQGNARAVPAEDESDSSGPSGLFDRSRARNFSELSLQPGSTRREARNNRDQSQKHAKSSTKEGGLKAIALPMTDSPQLVSPRPPEDMSKQPTPSHWSHCWEPSRTRSGSLSSESSQSPTTEPRMNTRYSPSYPESPYPSDSSGNRISLSFASPERDSFIDLYPLSSPKFTTILERSPTSQPSISTLKHSNTTFHSFSNDRSPLSPRFPSPSTVSSTTRPSKPPIPTTPKPSFKQFSSVHPPTDRKQRRISPGPFHRLSLQPSPKTVESQEPVPPTTNFLNADERADLVKKNRKLAQVFGTTPGAVAVLQKHDGLQPDSAVLPSLLPRGPGKARHARSAISVSGVLKLPAPNKDSNPWPLLEGTQYMTASGRRHSAPLTPDNFPILSDHQTSGDAHSGRIAIDSQNRLALGVSSSDQALNHDGSDSPTSFMDLSDEDISNDGILAISSDGTLQKNSQRPSFPHSYSTPSLVDTLTPQEQEEVDRRRKRDKLAKLHRFLGSRVPVELVLGASDGGSSIVSGPRGQEGRASKLDAVSEREEHRRAWLTRRRSSSAAVYSHRSDDLERLKEDLNDEEKALHVRRAQKMEKVFGEPPPQTLYTRPSASLPPSFTPAPSSGTSATEPPSPIGRNRNPNQTSYKGKKRHDRPGTSESTQPLLPSRRSESFGFGFQTPGSPAIPDVYTHYQHSLHSLNDIIDRDDRASLVELHQYLQSDATSPTPQEFKRTSSSASIKSDRRHSLPPSILSVSTGDSGVLTPKPEATDFQLRRRRAAKLTHFFGVDYRQIMTDILESIEKGVEEERKRGTLQAEEVEVLLRKVRTLKTKRNVIS